MTNNERCAVSLGWRALVDAGWWRTPTEYMLAALPDFEHDLNACERWLLPEIQKAGCIWESRWNNECGYSCLLVSADGGVVINEGGSTIAQAWVAAFLKWKEETA